MFKRLLIFFCVMCCFMANGFAANYQSSNISSANNSSWRFMVAPYVWVPWVDGSMHVKNRKSNIHSTPKDLIDTLDSAFLIHLEASKGKWTLMADPTYLKTSEKVNTVKITIEQVLTDFGVYYQVMAKTIGQNCLTGELFAGGRYWYMRGELSAPTYPKVSRTRRWIDPIIGGRLMYRIGQKWLLVGHGDFGGFNVASKFTWQLKANIAYQFTRYFGLGAGLRAIDVNYEEGHGNNKFKYNTITYGPVVGLVFTF